MKLKNTLMPFVLALTAAVSAFAGSPAARVGDSTSDGGTISPPGAPTVLIGGQPAARIGDFATSPLVQVTVPCLGGPIVTGSTTVLIGGKPAARLGDLATTVCGTQTITVGAPTVLIGN